MSPNPETPQVTVESLPKLVLQLSNGVKIEGRVSSLEKRNTGMDMVFQLSASFNGKCQVLLGNAQRVPVRHETKEGTTEHFHFDRVTLEGAIPEVLMAKVKAWVSRVLYEIYHSQVDLPENVSELEPEEGVDAEAAK